jgi:predicted enzyme related to lactoylglutathione lyase
MGAPVVHFEIMGGEGSELETFYRQVFGRKIKSNNPMKYGIVCRSRRQYHRTSYEEVGRQKTTQKALERSRS